MRERETIPFDAPGFMELMIKNCGEPCHSLQIQVGNKVVNSIHYIFLLSFYDFIASSLPTGYRDIVQWLSACLSCRRPSTTNRTFRVSQKDVVELGLTFVLTISGTHRE